MTGKKNVWHCLPVAAAARLIGPRRRGGADNTPAEFKLSTPPPGESDRFRRNARFYAFYEISPEVIKLDFN